ncbi:MAG: multiphosphoryl transfer protein, partial [Pseudonocardiales bacterium]|nr:multiphosphoryl transfer protein [Pseudonocardiales bacterium]
MNLVGIVVVSHSWQLAQAAVGLASEMLHERPVQIAVAAGLDQVALGTDAVQIKKAIEEVDGPAGVVVLMDLGSAVLSAELALDLLDSPAARERVLLSAAPLVEGLVVAAVAAAGGAGRAEVAAEAQSALMGKAAHLGETSDIPPAASTDGDGAGAEGGTEPELVAEFTVENHHGLHARPAARLVSEVRNLDAEVRLHNLTTGVGPVPAGSLSRVATLGAMHGHRVQIRARGPQASYAVEQLVSMAVRHFDEPPEEPSSPQPAPHGGGPLPASPGIGIGVVRRFMPSPAPADECPTASPAAEWQRVVNALAEARREIERLRSLAVDVGPHEARIFDAHLLLLDDDELLTDVKARVNSGVGAVLACTHALSAVEKQWADLPDPYLRARAEDVRAVTAQLLAALTGTAALTMSGPGILVAEELSPGQTAELDAETVRGIVLAYGSPTSHAAIIARSRGIPALVAAGPGVLALAEGTTI